MENSTVNEGKTMAIISYITLIGLIIAYFMNKGKENSFAAFHIKQSFRLLIFGIILSVLVFALVFATGITSLSYIGYVSYVLMALGIINAVNGQEKKLPIIG